MQNPQLSWTRLITCLTLLVVVSQAPAAASLEQQCEARLESTAISVKVDAPQLIYDYGLSTSQLTAKKPSSEKFVVLGLTEVVLEVGIKNQASLLVGPAGDACMRPRVDVSIKLNPQRVYIANEFALNSCSFREVLAHELRHVRVNQLHSEAVARLFEGELRTAFGNKIFYGKPDVLNEQLASALKTGWLPRLQAELKNAHRYHEQIDTVNEYKRMSVICEGQVGVVLRKSRS